jgi:hypothetical protein
MASDSEWYSGDQTGSDPTLKTRPRNKVTQAGLRRDFPKTAWMLSTTIAYTGQTVDIFVSKKAGSGLADLQRRF